VTLPFQNWYQRWEVAIPALVKRPQMSFATMASNRTIEARDSSDSFWDATPAAIAAKQTRVRQTGRATVAPQANHATI
jgi:hypothetical protein